MLGRFVVPVSRLDELFESAGEFLPRDGENPWRLSVLAGEDLSQTIKAIIEFNRKHSEQVLRETL